MFDEIKGNIEESIKKIDKELKELGKNRDRFREITNELENYNLDPSVYKGIEEEIERIYQENRNYFSELKGKLRNLVNKASSIDAGVFSKDLKEDLEKEFSNLEKILRYYLVELQNTNYFLERRAREILESLKNSEEE